MKKYPFKFEGNDGKVNIYCLKCNMHIETTGWRDVNFYKILSIWYKHETTFCDHAWEHEYMETLEWRIKQVYMGNVEVSDGTAQLHDLTKDTIIELKHLYGRDPVDRMLGLIMRHKGLILFKDKKSFDRTINSLVNQCQGDGYDDILDGYYQEALRYVNKYL